jgi:4-amino-4-deoxy-L-arabinose transferase-like glycosyltransferase
MYKEMLTVLRDNFYKISCQLSVVDFLVVFFIFICLAMTLALSFVPPTHYDSLVYHLALPEIYLRKHSIKPALLNVYAHFPANIEMLYTYILSFGEDIATQLLNFTFLIATIAVLINFYRVFFDNNLKETIYSAALFTSIPTVMLLSSSSYVESGVAFYLFASLYFFLEGWRENEGKIFFLLSAIFMGFALGSKYTAGYAVIPLLLVGTYLYRKRMFLWTFTVLLVFFPWMAKNLIFTFNPVFPFLYNVLNSEFSPIGVNAIANKYFQVALSEYKIKIVDLSEWLNFPKLLLCQVPRYGGGYDVLGCVGWQFLFFTPLIFFTKERNRERLSFLIIIMLYLYIFFIEWFLTAQVLRFVYPLLPIICCVVIYSLSRLPHRIMKYILSFALVSFIVLNFNIFFNIVDVFTPYRVMLGIEDKDEYLSKKLNYYEAFMFINRNLEKGSKIIFIGEQRGYGCKRDYIPTSIYQYDMIAYIFNKKGVEEVYSYFVKSNITHILINYPELLRLKSYTLYNFTTEGRRRFEMFLDKYATKVFSKNNVEVYKLKKEV